MEVQEFKTTKSENDTDLSTVVVGMMIFEIFSSHLF